METMLIQLLPDQVSRYWEQIRYSIGMALPPTIPLNIDMNRVLESLLSGDLVAWVSVDDRTKNIVAIVTTTITIDIPSNSKNLLIYSIFGMTDRVGKANWLEGFDALKKYAKKQGCNKIVGFTCEDTIKKLALWYGGRADFTLISIDI